jgi:hypothetical protein
LASASCGRLNQSPAKVLALILFDQGLENRLVFRPRRRCRHHRPASQTRCPTSQEPQQGTTIQSRSCHVDLTHRSTRTAEAIRGRTTLGRGTTTIGIPPDGHFSRSRDANATTAARPSRAAAML